MVRGAGVVEHEQEPPGRRCRVLAGPLSPCAAGQAWPSVAVLPKMCHTSCRCKPASLLQGASTSTTCTLLWPHELRLHRLLIPTHPHPPAPTPPHAQA